MQNTGLADIFEQAVFPALLYLPSLTPEDESLEILGAAYPVLIEMAGLTVDYPYPDPGIGVGSSTSAMGEQKQPKQHLTEPQRKLLDKIIREGIMVGYHHAKEHIRIVNLLCDTLVCVVNGMGILAVKYLKVPYSLAPFPFHIPSTQPTSPYRIPIHGVILIISTTRRISCPWSPKS